MTIELIIFFFEFMDIINKCQTIEHDNNYAFHVMMNTFESVGDTTFVPFAEGSRRHGGENIEADIGSEHKKFPPSLIFG